MFIQRTKEMRVITYLMNHEVDLGYSQDMPILCVDGLRKFVDLPHDLSGMKFCIEAWTEPGPGRIQVGVMPVLAVLGHRNYEEAEFQVYVVQDNTREIHLTYERFRDWITRCVSRNFGRDVYLKLVTLSR